MHFYVIAVVKDDNAVITALKVSKNLCGANSEVVSLEDAIHCINQHESWYTAPNGTMGQEIFVAKSANGYCLQSKFNGIEHDNIDTLPLIE